MPETLVKAIKPPRLKEKALRLELLNALRSAGRALIKEEFKRTTKTWKHKVKFEMAISLRAPGPEVLIYTDDQIWNWVDLGTKGPYPIFAGIYTGKSKKKVLAFPSAFTPKTRPGRIASKRGRRGGPTMFRPYVMHPGIKARKFTDTIVKKRGRWFRQRMEKGMQRAARASGHAMT